jgi:hypothetical protein
MESWVSDRFFVFGIEIKHRRDNWKKKEKKKKQARPKQTTKKQNENKGHKEHCKHIKRIRTSLTSPTPNPSPKSLTPKLRRNTVCMTALASGRPSVTDMVLERYMNEIAGARCEGSAMTAWSDTNTADWAIPVPKPLFLRISMSVVLSVGMRWWIRRRTLGRCRAIPRSPCCRASGA